MEKKVTVSFTDLPLRDALNEIERVSGIRFAYSERQLNISEVRFSLDAKERSISEILNELLGPYRITFRFYEQDSSVTLRREREQTTGGKKESISTTSNTVTGKVIDAISNDALAGVNVIIKGTTSGTTSDSNGVFTIPAPSGATLVFSFIGYTTQEQEVGSRTAIDIVLQPDNTKLAEVTVNAGYYEVSNKAMTGNIATVNAKQISNQPVLNPMQALQGRMAGVQITQLSGVAGDGFTVQVRGLNSVRGVGANEPLYIIDGVPFSNTSLSGSLSGQVITRPSPLGSINPADIESIDVLKDADATAIYGSRGANGVVLITTKRGQSGKTRVDVDFYQGAGRATLLMPLMNRPQYLQMRREAFKNDGVSPTVANAPDLMLWDTTRTTDWQKKLIGNTASITSAQASISGGTALTQFVVGGGYYRQTTVFPGDYNYQKGSAHFSINHSMIDNKLSIRMTGNFVSDINYLPVADFTGLSMSLAPNAPSIYDANGNLNWENGTWSNPYAELRKTYEALTKNLIANANVSYEVIPNLTIRANVGYNFLSMKEKNLTPISSQNPASSPQGISQFSNGSVDTWIVEPQIDYSRTIGNGKLSALVGATFQQTLRDRQGLAGIGYTNDTQLENLTAASTIVSTGTEYSEYKYNAVYGRLNYSWKEKYIVNLTARRDGSSRFGPNKRFSNFGAVGGAWIFSKEEFISGNVKGLSFGKLRASFGLTGSDLIGDYQYLDTYSATSNNYQDGKGLIPTRLVNPDFSWEENKKFEVGLDLGFLQDRISFSASYYNNRSSNQLVGFTLPAITGFTSIQNNLPATIQNTGVEFVVSASIVQSKKFTWNTSVNLTIPRNKLVEYPNIASSSYANTYQVDRSLFVQKKYVSTGVDPATGLYTFVDTDGNGALNTTLDGQFTKERAIDFFGGIQNTFTYKGFELSFLFQFVKQTGSNYLATFPGPFGGRNNAPVIVLDRWQKAGDLTDVMRYTQGGAGNTAFINGALFGDQSISDASFVKLQNASLAWNLPSAWTEKVKMEKARIYVQGQNLFIITDYKGANPEAQTVRTLPPLQVFTVGAHLTF